MRCDPFSDLVSKIRRHGNKVIALMRLCLANAVFPSLTFFQRLIDAKLGFPRNLRCAAPGLRRVASRIQKESARPDVRVVMLCVAGRVFRRCSENARTTFSESSAWQFCGPDSLE